MSTNREQVGNGGDDALTERQISAIEQERAQRLAPRSRVGEASQHERQPQVGERETHDDHRNGGRAFDVVQRFVSPARSRRPPSERDSCRWVVRAGRVAPPSDWRVPVPTAPRQSRVWRGAPAPAPTTGLADACASAISSSACCRRATGGRGVGCDRFADEFVGVERHDGEEIPVPDADHSGRADVAAGRRRAVGHRPTTTR